ncbi:hypothetical protein SB2_25600 [Methylobacterium radiotolerans]|nr:hypothetical protein SB3_28325 [Methylobacterium radiotolerans]KTS44111.1 hypothetical protein SB2_25600 [Methylobacterium radiotolerans]
MTNPVLIFMAVIAGFALVWIAISLHVLAAYAYEIVCILGAAKPTPLPDSRSENTGGRDHEGP